MHRVVAQQRHQAALLQAQLQHGQRRVERTGGSKLLAWGLTTLALLARHGFIVFDDAGDPEWSWRYAGRAQTWDVERLANAQRR